MSTDTSISGAHTQIRQDSRRTDRPAIEAKYQDYLYSIRQAISPYLKNGVGIVLRLVPARDGSGVVTLMFGHGLPNQDVWVGPRSDLADAIHYFLDTAKTSAGCTFDAVAGGKIQPGDEGRSAIERFINSEHWKHFEDDMRSLDSDETAMLMTPECVVIAKPGTDDHIWSSVAARKDADDILKK